MTVYNEADFIEYAIRACLPYVDHLVIVEGAYQETIALGSSARSSDHTINKVDDYRGLFNDDPEPFAEKIHYIEANEKTDKDQRNVGLKKIKELNPNGWLLIVDGDEVYEPNTFAAIKQFCIQADKSRVVHAAYFQSLTFVNDFQHFTVQEFPRLFKITPECEFINDNFMSWSGVRWEHPHVMTLKSMKYHHYAFCKGADRFKLKRNWWMNRGLGKDFDYGWKIDESGKITDKNHTIYEYKGHHPGVMKDHPLWNK